MTEQTDWRAKQPSQVACFSEDLVLRSLRHYLWAQSQGHHTIHHLEERGVENGNARRSSLNGRKRAAIFNQTNTGTVSKAMLGETSERRGGAHMGFSERITVTLN